MVVLFIGLEGEDMRPKFFTKLTFTENGD